MLVYIVAVILLVASIILAVINNERSPIYLAVLSAAVLYVFSGLESLF